MIAAWMVYIVVVSVLLAAGAWLAERGLRGAAREARWVWLAALFAPLGLGLFALMVAPAGSTSEGPFLGALVVTLPELVVGPDSGLRLLDLPLAVTWALMSGLLLCSWMVDGIRSRRQFRRGVVDEVDGVPTLVSPTVGPALVGVIRPRIVVPAWFSELEPAMRSLALQHEQEHARTRDPLVLAFGWAGLVAMPLNPVAWWMVRRLRMAVEIDCDARVLRTNPQEKRRYGTLLLEVASRAVMPRTAAVALSRPRSAVERRIRALVVETKVNPVRAGLLLTAGGLLAVAACLAPGPDGASITGLDVPTESVVDLPPLETERDLEAGPTFTPFTVAPDIDNRSEVVAALGAEYPPLLREAGIGGTVQVWFFVDAAGRVTQTRIRESAGHPALDQAAQRVAAVFEFSPAMNKGEPVPVWIAMPITFTTR